MDRLDAVRTWLARFPLSIVLLGGRIGVGATFFKAGRLKYHSFEFAVKLFPGSRHVSRRFPCWA